VEAEKTQPFGVHFKGKTAARNDLAGRAAIIIPNNAGKKKRRRFRFQIKNAYGERKDRL